MPKRIKVDGKKLVKMIKDNTAQAEIMEKFGFKNVTQLKVAYTNALMDSGKAPAIKKGKKVVKKETEIPREVEVGKRGSINIPKGLVAELGFIEGNKFFVKNSKAGITLSRKY